MSEQVILRPNTPVYSGEGEGINWLKGFSNEERIGDAVYVGEAKHLGGEDRWRSVRGLAVLTKYDVKTIKRPRIVSFAKRKKIWRIKTPRNVLFDSQDVVFLNLYRDWLAAIMELKDYAGNESAHEIVNGVFNPIVEEIRKGRYAERELLRLRD